MKKAKPLVILGLGVGTAILSGAVILTLGVGLLAGVGLGYILGRKKKKANKK